MGLSERCGVDAAHGELEMVLGDAHGFEDGRVDCLGLDVDDVHLLSDALKSRLGAKRSHVGPHETVGVFRNSLEVYVLAQLHVFGVNSEDFQPTDLIGNSNVDLSIEPAKPPQSRVQ